MLAHRRDDVVALALFSVAAGFLHAAVVDSHRGHGIAAGVFTGLAIVQILWAAVALARPNRAVLAVGAAGNAVIVGGWVLTRTTGIGFIDGFQEVESVGLTDTVTTGLEAAVAIGASVLALSPERRLLPTTLRPIGLALVAVVVAAVGVPAASQAGSSHRHDGSEDAAAGTIDAPGDHGRGDHADTAESHGDHAAFPILQVTGDGRLLGGDPTATAEQRAAAEKLLQDTRTGFWHWTDEAEVYAAGFRTIGDGPTGTEHLLNWNWINDDKVLDPSYPESLVYDVLPDGKRRLAAAMYMAPAGTPDSEIPDVGGTLTQWHIHNNLCFGPEQMVDGFPQRSVVGLTDAAGGCSVGEPLGPPHAPMLHVWVREHECGPFSSLEGVGAGQRVAEAADTVTPAECQHGG